MRTGETGRARRNVTREGAKRCGGAAVEWMLLAPPVLFWSMVFMAVAGVRPFQGLIEAVKKANP